MLRMTLTVLVNTDGDGEAAQSAFDALLEEAEDLGLRVEASHTETVGS